MALLSLVSSGGRREEQLPFLYITPFQGYNYPFSFVLPARACYFPSIDTLSKERTHTVLVLKNVTALLDSGQAMRV